MFFCLLKTCRNWSKSIYFTFPDKPIWQLKTIIVCDRLDNKNHMLSVVDIFCFVFMTDVLRINIFLKYVLFKINLGIMVKFVFLQKKIKMTEYCRVK